MLGGETTPEVNYDKNLLEISVSIKFSQKTILHSYPAYLFLFHFNPMPD